MSRLLSLVAQHIIEQRSSKFRHEYEMRDFTQEDLTCMDVNGDGKVTRLEFLEFMLVAMNKIDYPLLEELREYFERLDVTGNGELSREDLIEAARLRLKSPQRKLELATYKRRLLEQAAEAEEEKRRRQRPSFWESLTTFGNTSWAVPSRLASIQESNSISDLGE